MFRGKAEFGLVEAQSAIVVEHKHETDISKINQMIEQLKKGNSLKTIELKQKEDSTYGTE